MFKSIKTSLIAACAVLACSSAANAAQANISDFHLGWLDGINEQPYKKDSDLLARTYMVVFDGSGSMSWDGRNQCPQIRNSRISVAQDAVKTFAQGFGANDKVGMVIFEDGSSKYTLPFGYNQGDEFVRQVNNIDPDGGTPLRSSIALAFNELRKEGSRKKGHGEYHLVIVTDGDPSSSREDPKSLVNAIAKDSPIQIHTIGFCLKPGHALNQSFLNYYQVDNKASLVRSLQSVLAESDSFSNTDFN